MSPVQPEFHALVSKDREVQGTTFADGQAQFAVQATSHGGGRTELQLVPEVHYGPFQQHYAGDDAMFRLDSRRRQQAFENLTILASLSAGETLVLGRRRSETGTLGDRFFGGDESSAIADRLLLIRLSEERSDPLFATDAEDAAGESE